MTFSANSKFVNIIFLSVGIFPRMLYLFRKKKQFFVNKNAMEPNTEILHVEIIDNRMTLLKNDFMEQSIIT